MSDRSAYLAAAEAHHSESATRYAALHPLAGLSLEARGAVGHALAAKSQRVECSRAIGQELVAPNVCARHQSGDEVSYLVRCTIPTLVAHWQAADRLRAFNEVRLRTDMGMMRAMEAVTAMPPGDPGACRFPESWGQAIGDRDESRALTKFALPKPDSRDNARFGTKRERVWWLPDEGHCRTRYLQNRRSLGFVIENGG